MGCTSYTCCKWTNTQSENITSIIQRRSSFTKNQHFSAIRK
jgi:hypothetical protein